MFTRKNKRKAQSIVEYTLVAAVVIAALVAGATALKSKMGKVTKKLEDTVEGTTKTMDYGVFKFGSSN